MGLADWEEAAKPVGLQAAPAEAAMPVAATEVVAATAAPTVRVGWLGRSSDPAGTEAERASMSTSEAT